MKAVDKFRVLVIGIQLIMLLKVFSLWMGRLYAFTIGRSCQRLLSEMQHRKCLKTITYCRKLSHQTILDILPNNNLDF